MLHFVGHGENVDPANATRSEFRLSGRWRLTPSDISGETRNLGLSTPIVFMNACQVAQGSMALSGIGGWAAALTRAGAGAFVGTHWNVRDDLAHQFATAFYDRLVGGVTLAGAVREARQALLARTDGYATWLAYTVHAYPSASCTFAPPPHNTTGVARHALAMPGHVRTPAATTHAEAERECSGAAVMKEPEAASARRAEPRDRRGYGR